MDRREAQKATNESLFREVNERIEAVAKDFAVPEQIEFVCECADASCTQRLRMSLGEYEEIRAAPARFAVAHGHVDKELDRVVEERSGYVIVEKKDDAREVAERQDPRS
jgi:hypothetical protein